MTRTSTTTSLVILAGAAIAGGCAAPTNPVAFNEQNQPQSVSFDQNGNANFAPSSREFRPGNGASFAAADLEGFAPNNTNGFDAARPNNEGRFGNVFGQINPYGDIIAHSLPTEVDFIGESPDTANRTQVTFGHEGSDFDPIMSRDGETLFFASTQHRQTADIYARPIGTNALRQLTHTPANDAMPFPSPDGSRVAFASDRNGNWDIFVMPSTGGNAVQITKSGAHELHPSFSPDGRKVVFSRLGETSGRWELWVVELDNAAVAHFIGFGLFPEFCPVGGTGANGGDKIVFQRGRERGERAFSVWTIDYDNGNSSNLMQVAYSQYSALINPTWSPDGEHIVYASVPNPSEWASFEGTSPEVAALHMVNSQGAGLVTLTSGNSVDLMPTWGPTNDIFFVSNRGGSDTLWALDASQAVFAATGEYPADFVANVTVPAND
ncbi:MAG: hypothetical protein AAGB51_00260 [Planctomycetota bacterium]